MLRAFNMLCFCAPQPSFGLEVQRHVERTDDVVLTAQSKFDRVDRLLDMRLKVFAGEIVTRGGEGDAVSSGVKSGSPSRPFSSRRGSQSSEFRLS